VNKPSNIVLDPTARQGGAVWIEALPRAACHHARYPYQGSYEARQPVEEDHRDCRFRMPRGRSSNP